MHLRPTVDLSDLVYTSFMSGALQAGAFIADGSYTRKFTAAFPKFMQPLSEHLFKGSRPPSNSYTGLPLRNLIQVRWLPDYGASFKFLNTNPVHEQCARFVYPIAML